MSGTVQPIQLIKIPIVNCYVLFKINLSGAVLFGL